MKCTIKDSNRREPWIIPQNDQDCLQGISYSGDGASHGDGVRDKAIMAKTPGCLKKGEHFPWFHNDGILNSWKINALTKAYMVAATHVVCPMWESNVTFPPCWSAHQEECGWYRQGSKAQQQSCAWRWCWWYKWCPAHEAEGGWNKRPPVSSTRHDLAMWIMWYLMFGQDTGTQITLRSNESIIMALQRVRMGWGALLQ